MAVSDQQLKHYDLTSSLDHQGGTDLLHRSSDLTKFTPASAPILERISASASTTTSTARKNSQQTRLPIATAASVDPDNPDPLSTGAKAGIGVGVAVGVLVLLGLIAWVFLRRRKQKNRVDPSMSYSSRPPVHEKGADYKYEIAGKQLPAEVEPNYQRRSELG